MSEQFQNGSIQNIILDGTLVSRLRSGVEGVFAIEEIDMPKNAPQGTIIFRGELLHPDSEVVYDTIAERWRQYEYTPLLRRAKGKIELVANPGVVKPRPSDPRINLVLFIITLVAVLAIAALNEGANLLQNPGSLVLGIPFAVSFLAILGAHEFGHYFVARYHKVAVTLPYFIPFPTLWGTLGAFIQLRSPTKTRKELFDVGVAGPLAGLVVAVPVLIIGLLLSEVKPLPLEGGYFLEGNSIFYWLTKYLIFGQLLPGNGVDVTLHPVAWAGWSGLFVTVLNLMPVGQLDGGHVAYVLFGRDTRKLGLAIMGIMVLLGFLWPGWFFWAAITFFLIGAGHPPPLNDLVPLGSKRKLLAYAMIIIFVLLFMPAPIRIVP
jgi:membrane-associated protease RseP (regulator of RpoE activity)